jgi:hypothetical protein
VDELTDEEAAFFREGDAMSALADPAPLAEIIDLPSYRVAVGPRGLEVASQASEYYASFTLTIEADEMSGGFEAAA